MNATNRTILSDNCLSSKVCRICLVSSASYMSLFMKTESFELNLIADLVMQCSTIQIVEHDGYPDVICQECFHKLSVAMEFRETSVKSEQWLRKYYVIDEKKLELFDEKLDVITTDEANVCDSDTKTRVPCRIKLVENARVKRKPKFICSLCDQVCANRKLHCRHMRKQHSVFNCEHCDKLFATVKKYKKHNCLVEKDPNANGNEKIYERRCYLCNESFNRAQLWRKHRETTHRDNKCTICGQIFKHFNYLMTHVETKHFIAPFLCPVCGTTLSELRSLKTHINRVHLKVTRHACDQCDKKFFFPHQLRLHKVRIHENKREFSCEMCDAKFKEIARLRQHKLIHAEVGRYECTECEKKFKTPISFKRHKIWHTGVKKYVCEYCDKSFLFNKYLTQHVRIHTGEKPFVCKLCNVGFAQSASLKYHEQNHHQLRNV